MKAKEEMMQGIQIVKEMAQQELSSQKAAYESKIQVLEAELVRGRTVFFLCPCMSRKLMFLVGPWGSVRGEIKAATGGGEAERLCPPALRPRLSCLLAVLLPRSPSGGQRSEGFG